MLYVRTILASLCLAGGTFGTSLTGVVRDAADREPIGFATVSAAGTDYSISANEDGEYRLQLPPGTYRVKYSHVAHYSETIEIVIGDTQVEKNVYLQPALVEVSPITVYDRQYDAAQRIIIEAIKRKDQILSQIQQYSFEAYTKVAVRDTSKADSVSFLGILESQIEAYWKYPDHHKEIIVARRQTANVLPEQNLLNVGEILNFNRNRIDLGQYAAVSPTATDALDHYEYYLIDTTYLDGRTVFVLEIEPKNDIDPLFEGFIRIADSSFAIVGVDVTLGKGFDTPFISSIRYSQIFSEFEGRYWMPTLIQFSAIADLRSFSFLLPVIDFDYQAAIHSYDFSPDMSDTVFGEYVLEVDRGADNVDTAAWNSGQLLPLTSLELRGYQYQDSVVNNKPLHKKLIMAGLASAGLLLGAPDIFHFNRVEGAYLGLGHKLTGIKDRWSLRLKSGYAFDAELWQHHYGAWYLLHPRRKISIGLDYRDEVRTRPTVFAAPNGNPTLMALASKTDSYDYYREKGFSFAASTKLFLHTRLSVQYNNLHHHSLETNSDYSVFSGSEAPRINPAIKDGRLRSIEASFSYDSRKLIKNKGHDLKTFSFPLTIFKLGAEYASDDFIDNDFEFTRYYASLYRVQRMFGWGTSTLYAYAGASDKILPPQKYFTVDFDAGLTNRPIFFKTVSEENFSGSRVFAAYTDHNFGRKLFQKSGLPLIKHIPFSVGIHGGVFWTDFVNNPYNPGDEYIGVAKRPYGEIGFSLSRLIPLDMLSAVKLYFTWQLSDYATKKFDFGVGFGF